MVQIKLLIQAENIYVGRMLLHSVLLLFVFLSMFLLRKMWPVKIVNFSD